MYNNVCQRIGGQQEWPIVASILLAGTYNLCLTLKNTFGRATAEHNTTSQDRSECLKVKLCKAKAQI